MGNKWHQRFLEMAKLVATWSKDPSTKVGAVIVDPDNRIISVGFNGFARGVDDTHVRLNDRETKYKMVVHAESNALLFAQRSLKDCTLFVWPFMPCATCAAKVIQTGIKHVVAPAASKELQERWGKDMELTKQMFIEAGVSLTIYQDESKVECPECPHYMHLHDENGCGCGCQVKGKKLGA
jgi:dCMP deaminase